MVDGTCPLEEILTSPAWPSDFLGHILEGTTCSRGFRLGVETWHGSGGAWEVVANPGPPARFNE